MDLCSIKNIKELLSRHGFRFSKSMGQNFLTAQWVPESIADSALLNKETGVLEVGPGIGCLTQQLAQRCGKVVSVELDRALQPVLAETLAGCDNVELVFGDILRQNIKDIVRVHLHGLRPVVCANLPYNITTPVLSAFIEADIFDTVTVMVQREVARRICAAAGTSDYGAFSVYVNWYAEPEILFDVSPGCFMPQPKVYSSVLRLKRRQEPPVHTDNTELFFKVVRAAFNQRRKTLVNALSAAFPNCPKRDIEKAVVESGLDPMVRGETLSIVRFAEVADAMGKMRA